MRTQAPPAGSTPSPSGGSLRGPGRPAIAARTLRKDRWWLPPLVTGVVLLGFVVYGIYAALVNAHYYAAPYLSPLYAPCLTASCPEALSEPTFFSDWWFLTPAIFILPFPLGFRLTCYYYRKAYYRAFWFAPPACGVAEPHRRYTGETRLPLILQHTHRYFFYFAVIFAGINIYHAITAFRDASGAWGHMGVGTLVLVVNAVLLTGYTVSCHSCRHITGGRLNAFSRHPVRYWVWTQVSKLNRRHMEWAWLSLIWIVVADLYIRLVASGVITEFRFF